MPDEDKTTTRPWQEIAEEMTLEQDSEKLLQLAKQLSEAMDEEEREKVRKRLLLDEKARSAGAA